MTIAVPAAQATTSTVLGKLPLQDFTLSPAVVDDAIFLTEPIQLLMLRLNSFCGIGLPATPKTSTILISTSTTSLPLQPRRRLSTNTRQNASSQRRSCSAGH
jgi:hypothetical protein